jgi:four helix bundle protein
MRYEEWLKSVPKELKDGPVWRFYAYPKSLYLFDLAWEDCEKLMRDTRGQAVAHQLIRSVGSISANLEEGYGRGIGGKEYVRFLRIALGSARESKGWYFKARHLLPQPLIQSRLSLLEEIISLLVTAIKQHS